MKAIIIIIITVVIEYYLTMNNNYHLPSYRETIKLHYTKNNLQNCIEINFVHMYGLITIVCEAVMTESQSREMDVVCV